MNLRTFLPTASLGLVLATAAVVQAQPSAADAPNQPSVSVAVTHLGVGAIKRIDAGQQKVTIAHEAIPSLKMPPMTMPFRFIGTVDAGSLAVDQLVAFVLTETAQGPVITALQPMAGSAKAGAGMGAHGMPGMKGDAMPQMSGMHMMAECREVMSRK